MRGKRVGLIAGILLEIALWPPTAPAQSKVCNPSEESGHSAVCRLLQRGAGLKLKQPGRAASLFDTAAQQAHQENSPALEAEARRLHGEALGAAAQFQESNAELKQALALYTELHDIAGVAAVHLALGVNAFATGDRKQAEELEREAYDEYASAGDERGRLHVRVNQLFLSRKPDRRADIAAAIETAKSLEDDEALGQLLHLDGDEAFSAGDYRAAYQRYLQSAALFEKSGNAAELATVYTSLGRLQRAHGEARNALKDYRRAWKLQEQVGDRAGAVQTLNAIAVAYESLKENRQAIGYYRRALALARQIHSQRHILFELGNLGAAYTAVGEWQRGVAILEQVVREETSPYLLAYRYYVLSKAYAHQGHYKRALAAVDRSVELRRQQANQESMVDSLVERARILDHLNQDEAALRDTAEALRILEGIRAHLLPNDFLKQGFGETTQEVYDVAIGLRFQRGELRQAFDAAEEGRARAFLDLVASRENNPAARRPQAIAASASATAIVPVTQDSEASTAAFSADEMIAAAKRLHSTVLAYWSAPEELFVWVVREDGRIAGKRVRASRSRLNRLIDAALKAAPRMGSGAARAGAGASQDAWSQLYGLLIAPVERELPQRAGALLTIIPHGPLLHLPFSALRDRRSRYLVERFALHYVPAGALLPFAEQNSVRANAHARKYLLVADSRPVSVQGRTLPGLAGATREVASLRRILGSSDATVLQNQAAAPAAVTENMQDATVVHIAAHAVIDDANPLESYIALASPEGRGGAKLTSAEIYRLHVPADLVVLSACRTAAGKATGDGIAGMTRAFLSAGTATVVASLWDVPDRPTERLMQAFYRRLRSGENKATAMRGAQLELLRQLRQGRVKVKTALGEMTLPESPLLWAGFVVEGNP